MRHLSFVIFSLALFGLLQAPVHPQEKKDEVKDKSAANKDQPKFAPKPGVYTAPTPTFHHLDGRKLVFIANGAGGSTNLSDNLYEVNSDLTLGLRFQIVNWCRYEQRYKDLLDQDAQLKAAYKLACQTLLIRKHCPTAQIFYLGHSAGARVVIAAAEMLPADAVDRIIVFNAAVSCTYDLQPRIKASRFGIDNFYCTEDDILEIARQYYGMADGVKTHAAGRVGFRPPPSKEGQKAYCNLRQYRWTDDLCGSGGHCAWLIQHNMKKCLVPLLNDLPVSVTYEVPAEPPIAEKKTEKKAPMTPPATPAK